MRGARSVTFCGVVSVACALVAIGLPAAYWLLSILITTGTLPPELGWFSLLLYPLVVGTLLLGAVLGIVAFLCGDRIWGGIGASSCMILLAYSVSHMKSQRIEAEHAAARATLFVGSPADIQARIAEGADPNVHHSDDGDTPLHWAAADGRADAMRALMDGGADPNEPNDIGETPLHDAAAHGKVEAARLLLERGAEVDAKPDRGNTPLLSAIMRGLGSSQTDPHSVVEMIKVLLEHGANPNVEDESTGSALHCAARAVQDCPEAVALLIEYGASVDAQNSLRSTPLHCAAESGHPGVTQVLVDHGAALELPDQQDYTPLRYAAVRGNLEVTRILLEAGADPNAELWEQPLLRSIHDEEMAALLREYGARK